MSLLSSCQSSDKSFERDINFNHDWRFINSDIASALDPSFNDSSWRIVNLPHDIGVEDLNI